MVILFGRTDCIHFLVGEFDLPCVDVVDQFVAVHEVDADDVVIEFIDDIHRVCDLTLILCQIFSPGVKMS